MTKEEKKHLNNVQRLGCIVCMHMGFSQTPAEIHHIRDGMGTAMRSTHFRVLPLCPHHHRTGGLGEAFHGGPTTWEKKFGRETDLLDEVYQLLKAKGEYQC